MALEPCAKCGEPYLSQRPFQQCPDCRGTQAESPLPIDTYRYMRLSPNLRYREGYRVMFADECLDIRRRGK